MHTEIEQRLIAALNSQAPIGRFQANVSQLIRNPLGEGWGDQPDTCYIAVSGTGLPVALVTHSPTETVYTVLDAEIEHCHRLDV